MVLKTSYEGLDACIACSSCNRILYLLVPQGLSTDTVLWIEDASMRFDCSIAVLSGMDWNRDMTPWKAPGMFKKEKDFEGGAMSFLKMLESGVLPHVEMICGMDSPERILGGISLSGLFCIWASCMSEQFRIIVSISGSLWFDDFVEWFKLHKVTSSVKNIYFTLGEREHLSRDKRLATVRDSTLSIVDLMRVQGLNATYLEVPGTHFSPFIPRLEAVMQMIDKR